MLIREGEEKICYNTSPKSRRTCNSNAMFKVRMGMTHEILTELFPIKLLSNCTCLVNENSHLLFRLFIS